MKKIRLETFITPDILINIGFIYFPNISADKYNNITLFISAFALSFFCGFFADRLYNKFALKKGDNDEKKSTWPFLLFTFLILLIKGFVIYKIIY